MLTVHVAQGGCRPHVTTRILGEQWLTDFR
jgi:hypothetical protein